MIAFTVKVSKETEKHAKRSLCMGKSKVDPKSQQIDKYTQVQKREERTEYRWKATDRPGVKVVSEF